MYIHISVYICMMYGVSEDCFVNSNIQVYSVDSVNEVHSMAVYKRVLALLHSLIIHNVMYIYTCTCTMYMYMYMYVGVCSATAIIWLHECQRKHVFGIKCTWSALSRV